MQPRKRPSPAPDLWREGDAVVIECEGMTVRGVVRLASPNGDSLLLHFDAILVGHLGVMPVLRHDDGIYRSLIAATPVVLTRPN